MGFPRQEYWSGLPFPSPGDLPNPGVEPGFPALQADSLPTELQDKPNRKAMLKILQARLQQYMNWELPDVKAGFKKGKGTTDQIANIWWIMVKAREFQKDIYFCFIDYAKAFDCVDHNKLWTIPKEMGIPDYLTCLLRNLYAGQEARELDMDQQTASK